MYMDHARLDTYLLLITCAGVMYALIDYITFIIVRFLTGCTPIQQCLFYSVGPFATLWSGRINDVALICYRLF